jgi:hypothetical protein
MNEALRAWSALSSRDGTLSPLNPVSESCAKSIFNYKYENSKQLILQEKAMEACKQKGERRWGTHMPKPEEWEGLPHHRHCPLAKRREDRNPKHHEE